MERKRRRGLSLYYKFTLAIIVIGLVPVVILSTFLANRMIEEYRKALRSNYEQAADYVAWRLCWILIIRLRRCLIIIVILSGRGMW